MQSGDGTGQAGHGRPQHVWVNVTGRATDTHPGLLIAWRRVDGRWEGYVIFASGGGMQVSRVLQEWLRSDHIRPAERRSRD